MGWSHSVYFTFGLASFFIADLNFNAYRSPLPLVFFDSTKSAMLSITCKALGVIFTVNLFSAGVLRKCHLDINRFSAAVF